MTKQNLDTAYMMMLQVVLRLLLLTLGYMFIIIHHCLMHSKSPAERMLALTLRPNKHRGVNLERTTMSRSTPVYHPKMSANSTGIFCVFYSAHYCCRLTSFIILQCTSLSMFKCKLKSILIQMNS